MTRRKRPTLQLGEILGASAELLRSGPGQQVKVAELRPGAGQPRREFDPLKLEELARSIREKGVLQPLLIRPAGDGYEIAAGERRWRAAQLAGLTEVPVIIREMTDHEAQQLALIENLQREDLNLLDEVDAKLALVAQTLGLTEGEAKGRLMQLLRLPEGKEHQALDQAFGSLGENWQSFARGELRVLGWPEEVLAAVRQGLPFSLGAVIAGAPEQHREALIGLAQTGASRAALKETLEGLTRQDQKKALVPPKVVQVLGSRNWLESFPSRDRKAIAAWMDEMPAALKSALDG